MADVKHPAKAGNRFDVIVQKHRAALTPDERKLMALKKAADDAALAHKNQADVVAAGAKRLADCEAAAVKAAKAFEAAKAALEAK